MKSRAHLSAVGIVLLLAPQILTGEEPQATAWTDALWFDDELQTCGRLLDRERLRLKRPHQEWRYDR